MRVYALILIAASVIAGCTANSSLNVPSVGGSVASGSVNGPDVQQPGSPSPIWAFVSPTTIFEEHNPVLGGDGNIWFAGVGQLGNPRVGFVTAEGSSTSFSIPPKAGVISGLTFGPDSNAWFTVVRYNPKPVFIDVGKISASGNFTEYPIPNRAPDGIAVGPDGDLWVSCSNAEIDKVTTSGVVTRYDLHPGSAPNGIVAGSDGAMWFSDTGANAIGRITLDGSVQDFPLPAGLIAPSDVLRARDGNVWFAYIDQTTNIASIAKITPSGSVTAYPNPQPELEIDGLTVGPDGALWFGESMRLRFHNSEELGRITLGGVYSTQDRDIPLEPPFLDNGISVALGSDHNVWVSESHENRFAVYTWRRIRVSPPSVTVGVNQSTSIATTESHYHGTWTASSTNTRIATVMPGQGNGSFIVTGKAAGSCQIIISDAAGNSYLEPVTVQ